MNILVAPFVNALFGLYYWLGNLGWAVILVTVAIRLALMPLVLPSLKSAGKMAELKPKLDKLKAKYGNNKEKMAKAQMDLYKNEGINPMAGCLPQILQIAVLLMFFSAFRMVTDYASGKGDLGKINSHLISNFRIEENFVFNTDFLGSDLIQTPSGVFKGGLGVAMILPIILLAGSGLLQFLSAKKMMPNAKTDQVVANKTKDKEDDMAVMMRNQSTFMMPLMTLVIGWNFSLGILLYWFVNSGVMLGQQVLMKNVKK